MASFFKKYGAFIFIGIALTLLLLLPHIKEGFYETAGSAVPTGTSCPDGYTLFEVPLGSGTWKCYKNCATAGHVFYRTGKGQGYSTKDPDIKCGPPVPSGETLVYGYTDGTTVNSDPDQLIRINGSCPSDFTFDYGASVTSGTNINSYCYSICPSGKIPLQKAAGGIDITNKSLPFDATWCSVPPVKPTNSSMIIGCNPEAVALSIGLSTACPASTLDKVNDNDVNYLNIAPQWATQLSNFKRTVRYVWAESTDNKLGIPIDINNNYLQSAYLENTIQFPNPDSTSLSQNLGYQNYWCYYACINTVNNGEKNRCAAIDDPTRTSHIRLPTTKVSPNNILTKLYEYAFYTDACPYINGQVGLSDGNTRNMDLVKRTIVKSELVVSAATTKITLTETESKQPTTGSATTSVAGVVTTPAPLTPPPPPPTNTPVCKAAAGFYCPKETGDSETCSIGYYCKGGEKGVRTACNPVSLCDKIGLSEQPAEGMPAWKIAAIAGGVVVVGGILFVVAK